MIFNADFKMIRFFFLCVIPFDLIILDQTNDFRKKGKPH